MKKLIKEIELLIEILKRNNNESFEYFQEIKVELLDEATWENSLVKLINSGSIVQYANFNNEEESKYDDVYKLAETLI